MSDTLQSPATQQPDPPEYIFSNAKSTTEKPFLYVSEITERIDAGMKAWVETDPGEDDLRIRSAVSARYKLLENELQQSMLWLQNKLPRQIDDLVARKGAQGDDIDEDDPDHDTEVSKAGKYCKNVAGTLIGYMQALSVDITDMRYRMYHPEPEMKYATLATIHERFDADEYQGTNNGVVTTMGMDPDPAKGTRDPVLVNDHPFTPVQRRKMKELRELIILLEVVCDVLARLRIQLKEICEVWKDTMPLHGYPY